MIDVDGAVEVCSELELVAGRLESLQCGLRAVIMSLWGGLETPMGALKFGQDVARELERLLTASKEWRAPMWTALGRTAIVRGRLRNP